MCFVSLTISTHSRQCVPHHSCGLYHSVFCVDSQSVLTVVSVFRITHSRQYVLYHSQSSVWSVSLPVVSVFCITHSRQCHSSRHCGLYHSQSVCSVSLLQSSVCSVTLTVVRSLTVVSVFCITYSRQSLQVIYYNFKIL